MGLSLASRKPRPRKTLLYGVSGVGKTTWAAQAPGVVFIPTEDGLVGKYKTDDGKTLDLEKLPCFPLSTSLDQVLQWITELYQEEHEHKTLVIDTIDWLEQHIWAQMCREQGKEAIGMCSGGFDKPYQAATGQLKTVLDRLDYLVNDKDMAVILLAHAKSERFEDPEQDGYDRYTPKLHKLSRDLLIEWCDEVFFANYKTYTRSVEVGPKKSITKAIGDGDRIMRTSARPAAMASNRLGMPQEIPFTWTAYSQFLTS